MILFAPASHALGGISIAIALAIYSPIIQWFHRGVLYKYCMYKYNIISTYDTHLHKTKKLPFIRPSISRSIPVLYLPILFSFAIFLARPSFSLFHLSLKAKQGYRPQDKSSRSLLGTQPTIHLIVNSFAFALSLKYISPAWFLLGASYFFPAQ